MKLNKTILASIVALMGVSTAPLAVEKGDWILHVRAININPNDDSSVLNVGGTDLPGTGVSVSSGNSLDLSLAYMLTDNFAIELLADLSSKHDVSVFGLPADLQVADGTNVVETNVLPPTLFAQYHFNPKGKVRAYVGAGLNFTLFFNDDLTTAAQTALGASNLDMDSSFGLAGQFGIDFAMSNDWSFNIDAKYIQIDTTATFDSTLGPISVDVDINPWVLGIGFGKTF
ncbi:Outer membrane protein W precursor [hydrothermal vent metagenome]|uniref:Outer membrane protein W n=1 Tax=hydrothermal vent metagenome TaxID=652676 RepID=A0A3B0VSM8_9ZZZZ